MTINHAFDITAPFGGYKQSGNGREWGEEGLDEFLESKAILGYAPAGTGGVARTRLSRTSIGTHASAGATGHRGVGVGGW